jgi:hypothetical protein
LNFGLGRKTRAWGKWDAKEQTKLDQPVAKAGHWDYSKGERDANMIGRIVKGQPARENKSDRWTHIGQDDTRDFSARAILGTTISTYPIFWEAKRRTRGRDPTTATKLSNEKAQPTQII